MEQKISLFEQNLATVSRELVQLKETIAVALTKVDSNISVVGNRLVVVEKKINELNYKIDNLDVNTTTGFNDVGTKIESLTEEIAKISVVSGYDEQYKNLQKF